MAETLKQLGSEHVMLVTGRDGLDEITMTGKTDIVELKDGEITRYTLTPEDLGLEAGSLEDIQVDDRQESARIIHEVIRGTANTSAGTIVTMNAAAGLYIAGKADTLKEGVKKVQDAISGGTVKNYFESVSMEKESRKYA